MKKLATSIFACIIALGFSTITAPEAEAKHAEAKHKDQDYRFGQLSKDQNKAWKKQAKRYKKAQKHRYKHHNKRQKHRHNKDHGDDLSRGIGHPGHGLVHPAHSLNHPTYGLAGKKGVFNKLGNGFF
ncbi:MAG: hypothetical protein K8F91_11745 [Candidatus Obscuribacterales bacterium]|nr:hypothetical protein [Candidatus Obscuribacterales bacterium]